VCHWHFAQCSAIVWLFREPQPSPGLCLVNPKTALDHSRLSNGEKGDQWQNPALFDHVQVRNVHALLNSDRYPEYDWRLDFTRQTISVPFRAVCDFKEEYYGIGPRESPNQITRSYFVDFFPLFVLDLRHYADSLKN